MLEEKVVDMLDKLAQNSGVASEKIWEWALLQVQVDIVVTLLVLFIGALLTIVSYVVIKKAIEKWDEMQENNADILVVLLVSITAALLIVGFIFLFKLPGLILNPEYAAFQNVVGELSKLR